MQIITLPAMHDRINVAAWIDDVSGNTQLLARHMNGIGGNKSPDFGRLELLSLNKNRQFVSGHVVWEGTGSALNLEDPRARVTSDGRVLLGLTAVIQKENEFIPYPALFILPSVSWQGELKDDMVVTDLPPGKNMTPMTDSVWVYRKESEDLSLTLLSLHDGVVTETGSLSLDHLPSWASHKIGTTMPPLWINKNEALMLLHGVSKIGDMYHYALGRARLVRNGDMFTIADVDAQPFLIPDDLAATAQKLNISERHEFRRVVYCCGGILRGMADENKELSLYVNIGDRQTVEVVYPLSELTQGWW